MIDELEEAYQNHLFSCESQIKSHEKYEKYQDDVIKKQNDVIKNQKAMIKNLKWPLIVCTTMLFVMFVLNFLPR